MNKDKISSSYIQTQKELHIGKKLRDFEKRKVLITGVSKNNIGMNISEKLNSKKITQQIVCDENINLIFDDNISNVVNVASECDTLIICHGYTDLNWIENQTYSQIQKMIDVNLTSQIKIISEFVRLSIDKNYKKQIIIIGSMAGKSVLNGSSPYCAAKAGLIHFAKCIAWELAPKGYDVFIINPSNVVDSPMSEKTIMDLMRYRELDRDTAEKYWSAVLPKSSFLTKDEISNLVLNLMSGDMEYLSGCSIDLAGGQR